MSPELDAELCLRYPKIMAERNDPSSETCMCWGFEHSDGWFELLDTTMNLVQHHIDSSMRRGVTIDQVVFNQVKEKWGTLNIYTSGGDAYTDGVIRMSESISSHICEVCGTKGTMTQSGWMQTLCEIHHKERENRGKPLKLC